MFQNTQRINRTQAGGIGAVIKEDEVANKELGQRAWDNITGEALDSKEVKKTRGEEVGQMQCCDYALEE